MTRAVQMTEEIYRRVQSGDIPLMAEVRAGDWGTAEYWRERISEYSSGRHDPRYALPPREVFVCVIDDRVVGLVAGHLTRRFGCDGELQWISVRPEYRGRGIASRLLALMTEWFAAHEAWNVCVDVDPENPTARRFYAHHGAVDLKPSWMVWNDIRQLNFEK